MTIDTKTYARWSRGLLKYKLKPHQHKIYDNVWDVINGKIDSRSYVVLAARRLGKTFANLLIAIEYGIKNPGCEIQFIGPKQTQLMRAIRKSFKIIVEDAPPELRPKMLTSNEIRFPNGSIIYFSGTDMNKDGVRGSGSSLNIVEEAGFINNLQEIFISQLLKLTRNNRGRTIFVTTPPSTPDHDFAGIYRNHAEAGLVTKLTIFDSDLSEEQIQEEINLSGGIDSTTVRREDLCLFVVDEELGLCPEWKDEYKQDYPRDGFFEYYHKYIWMDIGLQDFTLVLFAYFNFKEAKIIIEDEVKMNGPQMTNKKLSEEIKKTRDRLGYDKIDRYVADNNNISLIQDLSLTYDLPFQPVQKTDLIKMVNTVRDTVGNGTIIVHPRCVQTIGCLQFGTWKDKASIGKMFARSVNLGHMDAFAALQYGLRHIDMTTNPIPYRPKTFNGEKQIQTPWSREKQKDIENPWAKVYK